MNAMFSSPVAKMRGIGWRPRIIRFQKYRVNGIVPVHAAAMATRTSSWTLAVVLGSFHIVLLSAANNSRAIKGHAVVVITIMPFLIFIGFVPNVSVHRRRTLCAVRCDALFNAFIFPGFHLCKSKKSENRPENRVFGLVEPSNSIFRPFFAVNFGFRGIARSFFRNFSL